MRGLSGRAFFYSFKARACEARSFQYLAAARLLFKLAAGLVAGTSWLDPQAEEDDSL